MCGRDYRTRGGLRRHQHTNIKCLEGWRRTRCCECSCVFKTPCGRRRHERKCRERRRRDTQNSENAEAQNADIHHTPSNIREKEGEQFPLTHEYFINKQLSWSSKSCSKCNQAFPSSISRRRHERRCKFANGGGKFTKCIKCSLECFSLIEKHRHEQNCGIQFRIECEDCLLEFSNYYNFINHRLVHGKNIPNPNREPWVIDGSIIPPWGVGEHIDHELKKVYIQNKKIILGNHDFGNVRGIYNFPLNDFTGDVSIIANHLYNIFKLENNAFKINF